MRTRSKLLMTGLGAAMLLAFAVGTASAGRLSISEREFLIRWAPLSFTGGGETLRCNVTLHGSFHSRTIRKTLEALIGVITRGTVAGSSCTNGSATILTATFPWHVRYGGFSGALPAIATITQRLINASFQIQMGGAPNCLFRTDTSDPFVHIANVNASGQITGLRADETRGINLDGGFLCEIGGSGFFGGTGSVHNGAVTQLLFIRLI